MTLRYRHHMIDSGLQGGGYAQTALADLDGCGRPEYVIGRRGGKLHVFKYRTPDSWTRYLLSTDTPSDVGAAVVDVDGDGDFDVISAEMEAVGGDSPPRWYVWENVDGKGRQWREHVILDANLGGHEIVAGDVTGNGKLDIIGKPWRASEGNAVDGRMFVVFLEGI